MPSGNTGNLQNPAGRVNQLTPPAQRPVAFRPSYDPTAGMSQPQVAQAQTSALRAQLRAHGYDVDEQGAATPRFLTALQNFQSTKGAGFKLWNAHNLRAPAPAFTPSTAGVPHPGHPGAPAHAQTAVGTGVSTSTGDAGTAVDTSNVGQGYTPQQLAALRDQYAKQFAGAGASKLPMLPTIDPTAYSNDQANTEYGPVIDQIMQSIKQIQGSEPGAQANISSFFAPVQAQAASGAASTDAAAQQNAADQAKLAPNVAASLGLTGAAAGGVTGLATSQAGLAANLATIMHQQGLNSQTAEQTQEQQAHTTEQTNDTNSLADARAQYLSQLSAKGSAAAKYKTDAMQQNYANQTQNITNEGALQNQKVTGALAADQILQADQGLQTTQQTQATNADLLPLKVQQATDAHAQAQQALKASQAQIDSVLHPKGASKAVTWNAVDAGTRENLAQYLRHSNSRANPAQAYANILGTLKGRYGYSGPNVRAYAKNIVDSYWAKNNPNWGWNAQAGNYTKKK